MSTDRRRDTSSVERRPSVALTRAQSIREQVSHGAATFFGLPPARPTVESEGEELKRESKWTSRRLRHCNRRYGNVKEETLAEICE